MGGQVFEMSSIWVRVAAVEAMNAQFQERMRKRLMGAKVLQMKAVSDREKAAEVTARMTAWAEEYLLANPTVSVATSHGTVSAYNDRKCRCEYCHGAYLDYYAAKRKRLKERKTA